MTSFQVWKAIKDLREVIAKDRSISIEYKTWHYKSGKSENYVEIYISDPSQLFRATTIDAAYRQVMELYCEAPDESLTQEELSIQSFMQPEAEIDYSVEPELWEGLDSIEYL